MGNPFVMKWIKIDIDKLIDELSEFATYFDKEVLLINQVKVAVDDKKYRLFINIPSTELEIIADQSFYLHNKKKINDYRLSVDCYPYEIHHLDISRKQYLKVVGLFKKISKTYGDKKELFRKNRIEMVGKICKMWGDSKDKKCG